MTDALRDCIKFNCDVSDARYWGYFSICGLLLRYRDLYRSEKGLKAWADISRSDIAAWIDAKEGRWPELEHREFCELNVGGSSHDPFDAASLNRLLEREGLVYGAGYGMYLKPTFFLAELKSTRNIGGLTVHIAGRELVRDLLTAPAMLQGDTIYVRLEPLLVLLHFKFSELNTRGNTLLEDAFGRYGFRNRQLMDETFERRLNDLCERFAEIILSHEIAEYRESIPEWRDILASAGDRKNEHYLRAVKDLIADTSESGPLRKIIETTDRGALALTLAFMEGFHRLLFPEARDAYREFAKSEDWTVIEAVRRTGHERFLAERARVVEIYRNSGGKENFARQLKKIVTV